MRRNDRQQGRFGVPGRRTRQDRARNLEARVQRPRILIVCEGKKTEPNYFLAFRVTNDVYGAGIETIRVVEEAIRRNEADGPYDQVWCVFDRDDFPAHDYDNAIHMVQSRTGEGFRVAYSNQALELWYVLHFEYLDAAVHRAHYIERLDVLLGRKYKKGDTETYSLLQQRGDEERAARFAQRLRELHEDDLPYSQRCPETTVDQLVQALREVRRN